MRTLALLIVVHAFAACAGAQLQPAAKIDFVAQVLPIFQARCFGCHGSEQQEGDLRLDRKSSVFHDGGVTQWVIVPGNAKGSPLYERITLPPDDPDIMPNEGDPLTPAQIAVIRDWIDQGAAWPDDAAAGAAAGDAALELAIGPLGAADAARQQRALAALRERGALAAPVAATTAAVSVSFALAGEAVADGDLALLAGLEPTLVWLDLSRTAITGAGLARLAECHELRRLNLSQTAVRDADLAHVGGLARLEYLNLWGTAVSDAGLQHLRGLGSLRKLYLWQSRVTDAGERGLRAALPELHIDRGRDAARLEQAAREQQPVNDRCPVTDDPVDPAFVLAHDGQLIGFCRDKCRAKFATDPGAFAAKVTKRAPPR